MESFNNVTPNNSRETLVDESDHCSSNFSSSRYSSRSSSRSSEHSVREKSITSEKESIDSKIDPEVLKNFNAALVNMQYDYNSSNCAKCRKIYSEMFIPKVNSAKKNHSEVLISLEMNEINVGFNESEDIDQSLHDKMGKHYEKEVEEDSTENECESLQFDESYDKTKELISYYLEYSTSIDKWKFYKWQGLIWEYLSYSITAIINLLNFLLVLLSSRAFWNCCFTISNVLLSLFIYMILSLTTIMVTIIMHVNGDTRPKRKIVTKTKSQSIEAIEAILARRLSDINEISHINNRK